MREKNYSWHRRKLLLYSRNRASDRTFHPRDGVAKTSRASPSHRETAIRARGEPCAVYPYILATVAPAFQFFLPISPTRSLLIISIFFVRSIFGYVFTILRFWNTVRSLSIETISGLLISRAYLCLLIESFFTCCLEPLDLGKYFRSLRKKCILNVAPSCLTSRLFPQNDKRLWKFD